MNVNDLVVGKHIVQLRNGKIGTLMYDGDDGYDSITVITSKSNECTPSFNDNDEFDIVKVGTPTFMADYGIFEKPKWIWVEETKEFTIKELEEHFNCKVKIIK